MKWFKHHTDAHADAKLRKLTIRYGAEGYALYWYCIELIAGKLYADQLTFELEHDAELIAHELKIDSARVQEIMRYMVNLELFESDNSRITCLKIARHLDERYAWSDKLKAIIRAAKNETLTVESLQSICRASADVAKIPDESIASLSVASLSVASSKQATPVCDLRKRSSPVPIAEIVSLYHETLCPPLPRVEKITGTREGFLRQRWQQDLTDLDHWRNYFDYIVQSDFLCGRADPQKGRRPFLASLEWITRPGNYAKIAEGLYHEQVREAGRAQRRH